MACRRRCYGAEFQRRQPDAALSVAEGKLPPDPWGQPYQYACPGTHNKNSYDVWSKGDPSHPSDIGNW